MTYERRARRLAADAVALVQDHERRHHDGERCEVETINVLAFIAHALGIHISPDAADDDAVRAFVARVRDYSANHEEHNG